MFYLKSICEMAWEESFSKIRVTGRCNGWFGASNTLRQWVRRVETSPPSHKTWRFLSDLTVARTWCASDNWTSMESWKTEERNHVSLWPLLYLRLNSEECDKFLDRYLWVLRCKYRCKESHGDSNRSWMKNNMIAGEAGLRQE